MDYIFLQLEMSWITSFISYRMEIMSGAERPGFAERIAKPGRTLQRRPSLLQETAGLAVPQARILPATLHKLVVGAIFHDLAIGQNHDAVERSNR